MATLPVKITLGGRERTLKYTLLSVAQFGERAGIKVRLNRLKQDIAETPITIRTMMTLLWAGLVHEDPELTEEQVGGWVDQDNARDVLNAFFVLFGDRLPETVRSKIADRMMGQEQETPETTPDPETTPAT